MDVGHRSVQSGVEGWRRVDEAENRNRSSQSSKCEGSGVEVFVIFVRIVVERTLRANSWEQIQMGCLIPRYPNIQRA